VIELVEPPTDGRILVADSGHGRYLELDRRTGIMTGQLELAELLPEACGHGVDVGGSRCRVFGAFRERTPNGGDVLVLAFDRLREYGRMGYGGGLLRVWPGEPPSVSWHVYSLRFPEDSPEFETCKDGYWGSECFLYAPHGVARLSGRYLVVADTRNDRLLKLSVNPHGDNHTARVHGILKASSEGGAAAVGPVAVEAVRFEDRQFLLVTFSRWREDDAAEPAGGVIQLWDVTSWVEPALMWTYPAEGTLASPNNATIVRRGDVSYLMYGHGRGYGDAEGGEQRGSVGLARLDSPEPPTYLGDLVADEEQRSLGFVAAATEIEDGARMLVTDSGCENRDPSCERRPRILIADLEIPSPPDRSGAHTSDHEHQQFIPCHFRPLQEERELLSHPFMAMYEPVSVSPES